jgi:hypothetical protein
MPVRGCHATQSARKSMFARVLTAATVAVAAIGPLSASAQNIDLSSLKCSDFLSSDQDTATKIMFWLGGYYTYEDDLPIINMNKLKDKEQQIKAYCADRTSMALIAVSDIFMDKKYDK